MYIITFYIRIGGLNDHPSPMDAMYRMRMLILGKAAGLVQSGTNTEDKGDEQFIVAKVLRETETLDDHLLCENQNFLEDCDSDSTTTSTTSSKDSKRQVVNVTEGCEKDGLRYLAGFIAKKFIKKYPHLGKFTQPHICSNPTQPSSTMNFNSVPPSWLQTISFGSLLDPSDDFFEKILCFESHFKKFHKNNKINLKPNVVKQLSRKINAKFNDVDLEIITAYVRQRTFIRMNYLNQIYNNKKQKTKYNSKAVGNTTIKKTKKVAT